LLLFKIFSFVLEFLINNKLNFLARFFTSFQQALRRFSWLSRANRPAWKKICTTKLLRDSFRTESDRSHVLWGEQLSTIPSRNSRSLRIFRFWCFGNDLAHGLVCYWESGILENLRRRCSTTVSPIFSFVSSSSFSSKGDQLRVTCASVGRTRSWPRVMDSRGASDCTWSRRLCRRHRHPRQPTRVTAHAAAARSSSVPGDRLLGPPGHPSGERRTTLADPSVPQHIYRRLQSPRRRWL